MPFCDFHSIQNTSSSKRKKGEIERERVREIGEKRKKLLNGKVRRMKERNLTNSYNSIDILVIGMNRFFSLGCK